MANTATSDEAKENFGSNFMAIAIETLGDPGDSNDERLLNYVTALVQSNLAVAEANLKVASEIRKIRKSRETQIALSRPGMVIPHAGGSDA